jgi:hypothetical protein
VSQRYIDLVPAVHTHQPSDHHYGSDEPDFEEFYLDDESMTASALAQQGQSLMGGTMRLPTVDVGTAPAVHEAFSGTMSQTAVRIPCTNACNGAAVPCVSPIGNDRGRTELDINSTSKTTTPETASHDGSLESALPNGLDALNDDLQWREWYQEHMLKAYSLLAPDRQRTNLVSDASQASWLKAWVFPNRL